MAGIYGKLGALQQAMFPLGPCSLPPPHPSIQSLDIPTSVAWQPGIYLKGRPHSNAYHQPALPAWRKPLSSFWLPHPRDILLCLSLGLKSTLPYHPLPATLKAVGDSGPHFNNCTFPEGLKSLLRLGLPGYSHFVGTYV